VVAGETHHVGPPFNGKTIGKTIGKLGFHGISWDFMGFMVDL
jgi:hypothetical protein